MKKINMSAKQQGFSLIELMVVLVIIGVLTAIVISQFAKAAQRNRILETTGLIGTVQSTIHDVTQMDLGRVIDDELLIRSDRIAKKYINAAGDGIVTPFGGAMTLTGAAGGTQYTMTFSSMSQQACDALANAVGMSDARQIAIGAQPALAAPITPTQIATACVAESAVADTTYPLVITFKR